MPRVKAEGTPYCVVCERCREVIKFHVNPAFDLAPEIDLRTKEQTGYVCVRHVVGTKCFNVIQVAIRYDNLRRPTESRIVGGQFVDELDPLYQKEVQDVS